MTKLFKEVEVKTSRKELVPGTFSLSNGADVRIVSITSSGASLAISRTKDASTWYFTSKTLRELAASLQGLATAMDERKAQGDKVRF